MNEPRTVTGRRGTDRGLSGLGLVMQLVGGVMTAITAGYLAMFVVAMLGSNGSGDGGMLLWLLLVLAVSLARAVAHKQAGDRLVFGGAGTPASALGRYLGLAVAQIAVVAVLLLTHDGRGEWLLFAAMVLGAWPLTLLLVARPILDEVGGEVPPTADGGLDGLSILLLVLGAIGVGVGAIMLLGWLEIPAKAKSGLMGISLLIAVVLLSLRSIVHLRAGVRGTTGEDATQTLDAADRYANVGVTAGLVASGLFIVTVVNEMPAGASTAVMLMLVMGAMVAALLLVWPVAVRRFVRDRQLTALGGNRPLRAPAADRGLPTLGWLLLALGVYALSSGLVTLLVGHDLAAGRRGGDDPLAVLGGMSGNMSKTSLWLGVAVAGLQTWAGLALIHMKPHYRQAGMAYGFAASAVALYTYLPALDALTRQSVAVVGNPLGIAGLAMVATALVIPVATLVLVQRKLVDPDAVADTFT